VPSCSPSEQSKHLRQHQLQVVRRPVCRFLYIDRVVVSNSAQGKAWALLCIGAAFMASPIDVGPISHLRVLCRSTESSIR